MGEGVIKRQEELIKNMTDRELLFHLMVTQSLFLLISIILGFIFFDRAEDFFQLWELSWETIAVGLLATVIVLLIDLVIMKWAPKSWYDDGGINEKLFQNRSLPEIFWMTLIVAFAEEILFRGVLQTHFGLFIASLIFAFMHFRYLSKWLLFATVLFVSFFLGVIFELTENILTTIFAHFLIDFVSAVQIRFQYLKNSKGDGRDDEEDDKSV
ncbi:hypothetical protein FB379_12660 [Aeribacillus composti]|nr:hypothetical protein FB379_12660 [Aeribacillus composti]